jgi:Zn-dependent protease with chaperone function
MADRTILSQISSKAWEHPADRAALNSLRAIPGFDEVVRKVASFFGERGVRQLFLANAVLVGDKQRPRLNEIYSEVLTTLDWPERPELYVSQTPFVNAAAVGFDRPFIVLNSATIARHPGPRARAHHERSYHLHHDRDHHPHDRHQ